MGFSSGSLSPEFYPIFRIDLLCFPEIDPKCVQYHRPHHERRHIWGIFPADCRDRSHICPFSPYASPVSPRSISRFTASPSHHMPLRYIIVFIVKYLRKYVKKISVARRHASENATHTENPHHRIHVS